MMLEYLDVPSKEFIAEAKKKHTYFDYKGRAYVYPNSKGERRMPGSKTLRDLLN